jgi:hypothetical protein
VAGYHKARTRGRCCHCASPVLVCLANPYRRQKRQCKMTAPPASKGAVHPPRALGLRRGDGRLAACDRGAAARASRLRQSPLVAISALNPCPGHGCPTYCGISPTAHTSGVAHARGRVQGLAVGTGKAMAAGCLAYELGRPLQAMPSPATFPQTMRA